MSLLIILSVYGIVNQAFMNKIKIKNITLKNNETNNTIKILKAQIEILIKEIDYLQDKYNKSLKIMSERNEQNIHNIISNYKNNIDNIRDIMKAKLDKLKKISVIEDNIKKTYDQKIIEKLKNIEQILNLVNNIINNIDNDNNNNYSNIRRYSVNTTTHNIYIPIITGDKLGVWVRDIKPTWESYLKNDNVNKYGQITIHYDKYNEDLIELNKIIFQG